jgi:alpha-N-arabinofuranosidase
LFSTNRGSTILPVTSDTGFDPVYWVASVDESTYYVKLANYGSTEESITIDIEGKTAGTVHLLSGGELGSNYPHNITITPQTSDVSGSGSFNLTLPAWAVAVLAVS